MASASSLSSEEQFLCSICQDVFSEPVTTPCGHNYCKACITGYWASCGSTQCPLCQRTFHRMPHLQVNTEFREMVKHFNKMRVRDEDGILVKPGEVPCDICLEPKLKAQKTCMVCLASYCQPHLEPHQRVASFQKHRLTDPVSNLEDRVCKKHNKMFELFCHEEQVCVCFMCLKDDHATHETVLLKHAFRERKARLDNATSQIKMVEDTKSRTIKEIKYSVEQSKKVLEKEIGDIAELLSALVVSLQRSQVELEELIQEKHKAAEKQAEDHVTLLEQEVAELRRRRSEMEQLSQTEDPLHLLQTWPSLHFPSHAEAQFDPLLHSTPPLTPDLCITQHSYMGMVRKAVAQMEKTVSNEMEMLLYEVRLSHGCEANKQPDAVRNMMMGEFIKEVWQPPQDKLMMIQQCDAVDVTMNAKKALPALIVSEDGKQLSHRQSGLFNALFGWKCQHTPCVFGKEGFSSGRFYYEVQVSGCKIWLLGVAKESVINQPFLSAPMTEDGVWAYSGHNSTSQEESFVHVVDDSYFHWSNPKTVGVFVDYEKGEVSFYDVDARTLIYSHAGCSFIETPPTLKAFLYSMAGTSLSSRPKLYPVFAMFGNDSNDTLIITPVASTT